MRVGKGTDVLVHCGERDEASAALTLSSCAARAAAVKGRRIVLYWTPDLQRQLSGTGTDGSADSRSGALGRVLGGRQSQGRGKDSYSQARPASAQCVSVCSVEDEVACLSLARSQSLAPAGLDRLIGVNKHDPEEKDQDACRSMRDRDNAPPSQGVAKQYQNHLSRLECYSYSNRYE